MGSLVCYGTINYDEGVISIDRKYPPHNQECALIHECLHGIAEERDLNISEKIIVSLAKGVYLFIKDNPEIFRPD